MSEQTTADATQADADATSQADTDAPQTNDAQAASDESISLEEAKKLRREANSLRKRLKELEDRDLSETDRLKAELDARNEELTVLRGRERERNAESVITKAATGAIKPEAIWRMVRSDIEYDDDGQPANVKPLIESVKREFPELFHARNGSADGGNGNGRVPETNDLNDAFRALARNAT